MSIKQSPVFVRYTGFPNGASKGYLTHGVHASYVRYILQNHWVIPMEFKDLLSGYHLKYWSPTYFNSKLEHGIILNEGIRYQVIYHKCNPTKLLSQAQIALSFRTPQPEYGMESYVLVSLDQRAS